MGINIEAEKRAYKKFIAAGMTPQGACALIGNLEAESDGFYTNRVEYLCLKRLKEKGKNYTDKTYTAAVDSGKITREEFLHPLPGKQYGYGLAQWTSPDRKAGLYDLIKSKHKSIADEELQITYLLDELRGNYSDVMQVLKTATSIRAASDVVLKRFESPADTGEAVCAGRAARGRAFYDSYVKNTVEEDTKVGVRVSNCGHDEKHKYTGGLAGDQTGTEWYLCSWYTYPWNYVLRWKEEELGNLFADLAIEAAENDKIGYDQGQRTTFGVQLQAVGWRPSKIRIACETDCSKGTIDLIRAVGYLKGITDLQNCGNVMTYTGNMMTWFSSSTGKKYFEVLTGKYLTDSSLAKRGDINLNTLHHVNVTVDNGANAGTSISTSKDYLSKGDSGSDVKAMQIMLVACGYSCGPAGADGDFGSNTDKALRAFQKANDLTVDGQYGPKSKAKLEKLYNKKVSAPTSIKKTVDEVAKEVIAGKWGTGNARKSALEQTGYDYNAVQKKVNEILSDSSAKKSITEIAKEVIAGKWGNGDVRKKNLEAAGYNFAEVQKKVNELL